MLMHMHAHAIQSTARLYDIHVFSPVFEIESIRLLEWADPCFTVTVIAYRFLQLSKPILNFKLNKKRVAWGSCRGGNNWSWLQHLHMHQVCVWRGVLEVVADSFSISIADLRGDPSHGALRWLKLCRSRYRSALIYTPTVQEKYLMWRPYHSNQ